MKILLIAPYGIGNTILALPAMKALRQKYPSDRLDLLTTLRTVHHLVEVIPDFHLFNHVYFFSKKVMLRIILNHYDFSILLFPSVKIHYNLLNFFTLAKQRIGALYPGQNFKRAAFLNHVNIRVKVGLHDSYQNLRLLRPLDIDEKRIKIKDITSQLAVKRKKKVIGIHPGCKKADYYRRWDNKNYIEVIRFILKKSTYRIRLFFGPDELEDLVFFQKNLKESRRIEFIINKKLPALFRKINECRVFLSNDSGLMHIASFLGSYSISLWGSSDFRRTGPFNDPKKIIFPRINCRPCAHSYYIKTYKFRCIYNDIRCMKMITVNRVIKELEKFF